MREFGITYIIAAVGGVVLPGPLKWWPFVIATVVAVVVLATQMAEASARVKKVAEARDLAKTQAYLAAIRKADVEEEWDDFVAEKDADRPLGTATDYPPQMRILSRSPRLSHVPAQPTGGHE